MISNSQGVSNNGGSTSAGGGCETFDPTDVRDAMPAGLTAMTGRVMPRRLQ